MVFLGNEERHERMRQERAVRGIGGERCGVKRRVGERERERRDMLAQGDEQIGRRGLGTEARGRLNGGPGVGT